MNVIPERSSRFVQQINAVPVILSEPQNSLIKQYEALLGTEEITVEFTDDAIELIARTSQRVNEDTENIGARRLHTVMEYLLEEISFEAPERGGDRVTIDAAEVERRLSDITEDRDLSKYIL